MLTYVQVCAQGYEKYLHMYMYVVYLFMKISVVMVGEGGGECGSVA
jgi:hypothetical protein